MTEVVKFGESDTAILVASIAESGPQKLTYNADGSLNYVEVIHGGVTYRQTFSYTSGNLTGVSAWVKQ